MKKTTVKVKQRIQHFVVMTETGDEDVYVPGTIMQARREINNSGRMLEKNYIGEEIETYEMPLNVFIKNAKKVGIEEK